MYPIGARVTVTGTTHLPQRNANRLIGRTGTVRLHENGLNIVTGLTLLGGAYAFGDYDLTPTNPREA